MVRIIKKIRDFIKEMLSCIYILFPIILIFIIVFSLYSSFSLTRGNFDSNQCYTTKGYNNKDYASLCRSALVGKLISSRYSFNAPSKMKLLNPETIALVIDSTGGTNFEKEFQDLNGSVILGITPISFTMEAEIVGPAFEISPKNRQRKRLSRINPTRWDWEVTPKRKGKHQLEVSLYVVDINNNIIKNEEKVLAKRHIVNIYVPTMGKITSLAEEYNPLIKIFILIFGAIAALFAWLGYSKFPDFFSKIDKESSTQKIEVTIKGDGLQSKKKKKRKKEKTSKIIK